MVSSESNCSPVVSVVCPTYNRVDLLRETMRSVRAQTFTDFECVIIDDGCSDGTAAYLEQLTAEDARFRVVRQANAGIGAARNRGMGEARGTYIALLDHDDLWLPEKLAKQVAYMDAHPDRVASLVPWAELHTPNRLVFDPRDITGPDGILLRPFKLFAESKLFVLSSALMIRRSAMTGLGNQTARKSIEDSPFYAQLLPRGTFGFVGTEPLMLYRFHEGNASSEAVYFSNGVRRMRQMLAAGEFDPLTPQQRDDLLDWLGAIGRTAGVRLAAAGLRRQAIGLGLSEFGPQLARRRWKFLATYPLLCLLPPRLVRRVFAK